MENWLIPIISNLLTLVGVILTNSNHTELLEHRIDELSRDVRELTDISKRIAVLEERVNNHIDNCS